MKALLVNLDLMVRVIVPDDATPEDIADAAANKAVAYASDKMYGNGKSWVAEGVGDINDDVESPYNPDTDPPEYIALQNG